jgi:purine/pyrimidine-nucleoside phosphorylase
MEILAGDLEVLLPGSAGWKKVKAGDSFYVPAQSTFSRNVKTVTGYCRSYIR